MNFEKLLKQRLEAGDISEKVYQGCFSLHESYAASLKSQGIEMEPFDHLFETLLNLTIQEYRQPHPFEPFHRRITTPYNYYKFGVEFIRPLVDRSRSHLYFPENVKKIDAQILRGENAILFANHQTEVDPQLMSLILEESHPHLGEEVIFVAGDRVITDTLAIPFSKGRNLLCIYSKRHIDNPPERKEGKLKHNQRTMQRMKELLSEGGKFIYVAPSGGRDRPDASGEVVVAPFDAPSIEMFRLMAKQANKPVHFYPLSLDTFDILPPPATVEKEIGEMRRARREGALFSFGNEIDMENFPGSETSDRHEKRNARAQYIWDLVNKNYTDLKRLKQNQ